MLADLPGMEIEIENLLQAVGQVPADLSQIPNESVFGVDQAYGAADLLENLIQHTLNIIKVDIGMIFKFNADQQLECCSISSTAGQEKARRMVEPPFVQRCYLRAAHQDAPLIIHQRQGSLSLDEGRTLRYLNVESLCMIPIRMISDPMGLLVLAKTEDLEGLEFHDGRLRLGKLMADQIARVIQRARLSLYVRSSNLDTILALSRAIENHDPTISGHSKSMVRLAERTAEKLGCSRVEVQTIGLAALLHDVGKIGIPDSILKKPGPLSGEEWDVLKTHPVIGAEVVLAVSKLRGVSAIIHSHHERFDGLGYPNGLKGSWIPFGSRILSVVDAYDAMTSGRIYRRSRPHEQAIEEIVRCSEMYFDPVVIEAFLSLFTDSQE
jgi:putative nucleotidyltransferase with HDIG domain